MGIGKEVKKQLLLAGPLFTVGLSHFGIQVISLMFVGHLSELDLSGASMATSFASVTGFHLLMLPVPVIKPTEVEMTGMASALETLCGQSFGAEQHKMLGIYTQTAMLVLSLVSILLSIIWANTKLILIAMHQDATISEEAGKYARFMIPSIFAFGLLQSLVKFLQTQNNVLPMMLTSVVSALLHVPLCWALVFKSRLGSRGAAVANSISYWNNALLLALYVKFSSSCSKTWTGFSKEAFHHIISFVKIAIPSALMMCLMVWTFETMVILSGLLPNPKLETSVLSICLNTFSMVWTIPFGFSAAVSTRVSNELGSGNPQAAQLAALVVLFLVVTEGLVLSSVLVSLRKVWGHVFSNEEEVVNYIAAMMPFLAASSFLDGLQSVLSGVARGCGRQKIGACVNLGSYYLVGIPTAIVLAFVLHIKAKGLWLGIVSALLVQVLFLLFITLHTNWEKQANKATKRVGDSKIPVHTEQEG